MFIAPIVTPGSVMKASLDGGYVVTLVANVDARALAVDATSVYFATDDGIYRLTPK